MILITTPTGRVGGEVVRRLMSTHTPIRLLLQDAGKLPQHIREHAYIVEGSHCAAQTLQIALSGVERVFWCVPQSPTVEHVGEHYIEFSHAFAALLKKCDTIKVVGISSGGMGRAKNAGPISALHAMEHEINAAGAPTRFLRCGSFMENLLWQVDSIRKRGVLGLPIRADVKIPTVAARDIASVATRWLMADNWNGQEGIAVHGPEDLPVMIWLLFCPRRCPCPSNTRFSVPISTARS